MGTDTETHFNHSNNFIDSVNGTSLIKLNISNSDNITMHETTNAPEKSRDPLISLTVPAIMFTAGVLGNLLAILFLARSPGHQKRSIFYRLVGGLAITDLFGTCATSPVTLVVYSNNLKWVGGAPLCNYVSFMLIFATCSTISIIGAMAIERFMSICRPFVYERYVSIGKVNFLLLGLWTFAAIMGCMPIIGFGENVLQFPGTWCFFTFTSGKLKNKLFAFLFVAIGICAITVTAISNLFVIRDLVKIWRKAKKAAACSSCTDRHSNEVQMMVLMIGIVLIFTVCWCPFLIRIIINQINERQVNVKTDLLVLRLASLNQILDPWIYILFRKELFSKIKDVVITFVTFLKPIESSSCRIEHKIVTRNGTAQPASEVIDSQLDSLKNNIDDSDGDTSELSSFSGWKPQRRMSLRQAWQHTKSRHEEKSNLQKLMTQHTPACFGFMHPVCLFSFAELSQTPVLSVEMNSTSVPGTSISEEEDLITEPHT